MNELELKIKEALELINDIESTGVRFNNAESKRRSDHNSIFLEALRAVLDDVKDSMREYIEEVKEMAKNESSEITENK